MKPIVPCIITLSICLSMCSCATSRISNHGSRIAIDTFYLSTQQYDSIYIYQDKLIDRTRDTVYLKDISIEYRYKQLRDTIKVIQKDSIPYEVTIIETKEITRPLTWYDKLCRSCFWFILGFLHYCLYLKVKSINLKP